MEGRHPDRLRGRAEEPGEPFPHLPGRLVGEGDGQDPVRRGDVGVDQALNAVDQHPGLAGSGSGQDQGRTGSVFHGRLLGGIEGESGCRVALHIGSVRRGFRGRFAVPLLEQAAVFGQVEGQQGALAHAGLPGRSDEQAVLRRELFLFPRAEDPDAAVFAVVPLPDQNLPGPHAPERFGEQGIPGAFELLQGQVHEDGQLRTPGADPFPVGLCDLFAGRAHAQQLAEQFLERNQGMERLAVGALQDIAAVGELHHPVGHAHGHRFAAFRAQPVVAKGRHRIEAHPAFAVSVKVVFALLGEKGNGPDKAFIAADDGLAQGRIAQSAGQQVGVAPQFFRRVGVGVGQQGEVVQEGAHPVHGRVRGQSHLHRGQSGGQFFETFGRIVKARFGAQRREPGGPDVGRDEHDLLAEVEAQIEQILGVEAEDGTAVRGDVADRVELALKFLCRGEIRQAHQVVHLAHPAGFFIDIADFPGEHEADLARRRGEVGGLGHAAVVRFQAEQPVLGRLQLLAQLGQPSRMGDVPAADHLEPLDARPVVQVFRGQLPAGRPRVRGMDVQIGDDMLVGGHGVRPFPAGGWIFSGSGHYPRPRRRCQTVCGARTPGAPVPVRGF